mmetsp:Transcript_14567/g.26029  ORF Transcript_14567/g.26029 Transcript_14567/m.26029 type:complete len:631 (+) Transcript_14567:90-1982(+)
MSQRQAWSLTADSFSEILTRDPEEVIALWRTPGASDCDVARRDTCLLRLCPLGFVLPRASTPIGHAEKPSPAPSSPAGRIPKKVQAKAKGKARLKPPPPPGKTARQRPTSTPPPAWKGPQPSPGAKSDRVVNWNPIRQAGLLEGSIWQQVNQSIDQRGQHLLPKEALDRAFVRSVDEATPKQNLTPSCRRRTSNERRILRHREALVADLLYNQLTRRGLADLEALCGAVGMQPLPEAGTPLRPAIGTQSQPTLNLQLNRVAPEVWSSRSLGCSTARDVSSSRSTAVSSSAAHDSCRLPRRDTDASLSSSGSSDSDSTSDSDSDSSTDTDSEDEPETEKQEDALVDENSLETLLAFLHLADGIEEKLKEASGDCSTVPLAAPERLLQQVVTRAGPLSVLQSRVQAVSSAAGFAREANDLEKAMRSGIAAARAVVDSNALPVLLEGVLLLGNYVNSSSRTLGSALGVTIESVAKLAHTRSLPTIQEDDVKTQDAEKSTHALGLLVRQLEKTQDPSWLSTLRAELENCRAACDSLSRRDSAGLQALTARTSAVERCFSSQASIPRKYMQFLAFASARLAMLRILEEDLQSATVAMRRYFAEQQGTTLSAMLRNLALLLDVLPKPTASNASSSH